MIAAYIGDETGDPVVIAEQLSQRLFEVVAAGVVGPGVFALNGFGPAGHSSRPDSPLMLIKLSSGRLRHIEVTRPSALPRSWQLQSAFGSPVHGASSAGAFECAGAVQVLSSPERLADQAE
jgi:hypothetical protein